VCDYLEVWTYLGLSQPSVLCLAMMKKKGKEGEKKEGSGRVRPATRRQASSLRCGIWGKKKERKGREEEGEGGTQNVKRSFLCFYVLIRGGGKGERGKLGRT